MHRRASDSVVSQMLSDERCATIDALIAGVWSE
jgi:hypothetical protein